MDRDHRKSLSVRRTSVLTEGVWIRANVRSWPFADVALKNPCDQLNRLGVRALDFCLTSPSAVENDPAGMTSKISTSFAVAILMD